MSRTELFNTPSFLVPFPFPSVSTERSIERDPTVCLGSETGDLDGGQETSRPSDTVPVPLGPRSGQGGWV